jgi:Surface glycan-binding protein B xyloglucan binding domain/IPT/TIG domain
MKKIFQLIKFFAIVVSVAGVFSSCKKDDDLPNNGEPRIRYVRVTNPVSADSLLVGAYQGNLIAIIGENLQNATQVWFNDQKAVLTPTYITSNSILVTVPSQIPKTITNILKIVFSDGRVLEYSFKVIISEPVISNMVCEYAPVGTVVTIRGDYFYEPLTVTFAGGVNGEIVSVTDKVLNVRIPAGAAPGQLTVTTNFGTKKSDFWFNDTRNIFISSDPFTGWWNASYVVTNPGPSDPVKLNGNYIRITKPLGGWSWNEVAGGPPSAMGPISKNVPDDAILKPADYNLKFEINTIKPYTNNVLKINVGLAGDFNNNEYRWLPPYDSKGQWQTVVIPFEDVAKSYGAPLTVSAAGYYTRLLFHGPGDLDCDICFDNFRVVPKVLK